MYLVPELGLACEQTADIRKAIGSNPIGTTLIDAHCAYAECGQLPLANLVSAGTQKIYQPFGLMFQG